MTHPTSSPQPTPSIGALPGPVEIKLRAGGYFVDFEDGWSGPWATEQAAELARDGKFEDAHRAERERTQ